jgi:anion-transporting  ArsA/GET3 family ATPase
MSAPLDLRSGKPPLVVVVGSGGVGKTTLAAALGLVSAQQGIDSLVMTFDPSLRLKDALGVGLAAEDEEIPVAVPPVAVPPAAGNAGILNASLLDARRTFDRLIISEVEDEQERQRILGNRYYQHLAGHLGGILEYMAVERLYEVAQEGRYGRLVLDTPPTAQAIDFLEAPQRIVSFLDSGALKIALKPWFDEKGHLRGKFGLSFLAKPLEQFLDKIVGLQLLRDMSEFFQAFEPMFEGFRDRAREVEKLLRSPETVFVLVTGPGEARIPDTLFFARRLKEAGLRLGPIVVNRVHPHYVPAGEEKEELREGLELLEWLGASHRKGIIELRRLLPPDQVVVELPLEAGEPTSLPALAKFGQDFQTRLEAAAKPAQNIAAAALLKGRLGEDA